MTTRNKFMHSPKSCRKNLKPSYKSRSKGASCGERACHREYSDKVFRLLRGTRPSSLFSLRIAPRANIMNPTVKPNIGMHNPPPPGEILLEDVIPALGITITEMARRLGFARETFSRILHGHAPVSPDLAVRLERAGVSTAQLWLSMQSAYDLWQAEHREQPVIERFARID